MLSPAFRRRLDGLDAEGLRRLVSELVVRQEKARVRFSRSRSVRDGESYSRRSHELGEARTRLRLLS